MSAVDFALVLVAVAVIAGFGSWYSVWRTREDLLRAGRAIDQNFAALEKAIVGLHARVAIAESRAGTKPGNNVVPFPGPRGPRGPAPRA